MAAVFNPSMIMTGDFYQENYSDDKSLSSREIEHVLGEKMDPALANFVDSMTGKAAAELREKMLNEKREY